MAIYLSMGQRHVPSMQTADKHKSSSRRGRKWVGEAEQQMMVAARKAILLPV